MKKSVGIIGGDLRNLFLSKNMAERGYSVALIGFDKYNRSDDAIDIAFNSDIIIGPVPFDDKQGNIYAPYWSNKLSIEKFLSSINNRSFLVAGSIGKEYLRRLKAYYFDITKEEEFALANSIPTSEGIIEIAIKETDCTLHNSKIMILGFGRIAKRTAILLHNMGARLTIASKEKIELEMALNAGYKIEELTGLEKVDFDYNIIINTIPSIYLTPKVLTRVTRDTLIIDVASSPGGLDIEFAETNGFNIRIAKGIPGKVAPKSVASYMLDIIEKRAPLN